MSIDWTQLSKKYKGEWVALKSDEKSVVGYGNSAAEAWKSAQKKGYKKPILTKMPQEIVPYIGYEISL